MAIQLSMKQKKWLLSLHLIFAGILLGETAVIVILSLTALFTDSWEVLQACYTILHLLARTGVRASTIGTVITGILLSVLTHWGMFRYYWIIVKEGLTLLSIAIGIVGFYVWSLKGLTALYQKCGFRIVGIDRDFFTDHYPEPIYENGIWCRDMIRLSIHLSENE